MMLTRERHLLVWLALRELAALENQAEFAVRHHADADQKLAEIAELRTLIEDVPFGRDGLREYDERRKNEGHAVLNQPGS